MNSTYPYHVTVYCPTNPTISRQPETAPKLIVNAERVNQPTALKYKKVLSLCWLPTDKIIMEYDTKTRKLRKASANPMLTVYSTFLNIRQDILRIHLRERSLANNSCRQLNRSSKFGWLQRPAPSTMFIEQSPTRKMKQNERRANELLRTWRSSNMSYNMIAN